MKRAGPLLVLVLCLSMAFSLLIACSGPGGPPASPSTAGQPAAPPARAAQSGPMADLAAALLSSKKQGVVVLGKTSGQEKQEMAQVRDYLRGRGYDAQLVSDLPEISAMTNEEKVRLWVLSSRFAVMIDRLPAGHIAEYVILREQRSILALLRPVKTGSTWMIGDDPWVDSNFIKVFEFEQLPVSVMDDAVRWAEGVAGKRAAAYDRGYPWRSR